MADMLRVECLTVHRGSRRVLTAVDFTARAGRVSCVLGPNGAGKSTLLRAIAGLLPYEGSIRLDERELRALDARERARAIAYVPQQSLLEAPLSVETVVAQGRYAHTGGLGAPSARDREAIARAMARADVASLAERRFDRLSTGERRRVLVARALATDARTLLLDEPTAALDVRHALELHALLRVLAADGYRVVLVLHALDDARRHTDAALLLERGAVVAEGPSAEVIAAEHVRDVYGVELVEQGALGVRLPRGGA